MISIHAAGSTGAVSPGLALALAQWAGITPTQVEEAVADYLAANPPTAAPDATSSVKGVIALTGDLGGTAAAPTVPGLAGKVAKGELVVNVKDYGATGDGTTDDTAAIQAAIDALTGNTSLAGGVVFFPEGVYRLASGLTIAKPGIILRGAGSYTAYLAAGAALGSTPLIRYAIASTLMRGVQIDNLAINMGNHTGHAIEAQGAFDNAQLSNVWIEGVHKDYSAVRFVPAPGAITDVSQTILILNCYAQRHPSATTGVTAPLWYFNTVQEATIIGAKAIGAAKADGGQGFAAFNCSSVSFYNCSAAQTTTGWHVSNQWADSAAVRLDGPLFETLVTGLVVAGHDAYPITRVTLRDLRKEGVVDAAATLSHCSLAAIDSDVLPLTLGTGVTQAHVTTADASQVTDTSGGDNTILGWSNGVNQHYSIAGRAWVKTVAPTSGQTSFVVQVNNGTTTTMHQVVVGDADSAGSGFRSLRVPN